MEKKYFSLDYDFGSLIREERELQGIQLKELASKIRLSEQALSQYERGMRKIKYESASMLAEVLGYTIIELLDKYDHSDDIIPEWFWGQENDWEVLLSPSRKPKAVASKENPLAVLAEKMGYFIKMQDSGNYSVKFPDGYKLEIKSADLEAVTEKSADYINMLFTQLRHDHGKK
jgi:transcriptional regulator with XRE-family HTH domain